MANTDLLSPAVTSKHRLPTITASQALHNVDAGEAKVISLGLPTLDAALLPPKIKLSHESGTTTGGIARAQVTEVYGPPGTGKTMMCIQASANALKTGDHVVWIDCATRLSGAQLYRVVAATKPSMQDVGESLKRFHHMSCPSLPHLLALFLHNTPSFPVNNTSLIVVESPASLLDLAYPRQLDDRSENGRWISSRRLANTGELARAFARLAAVRNLAVIVTTHATTKLRGDSAAILKSAIANSDWDDAIAHRIVLFQDWAEENDKDQALLSKPAARFASISRSVALGRPIEFGHSGVVAFDITSRGLYELPTIRRKTDANPFASPGGVKRSSSAFEDDQAEHDSDDEYGWVEDDNQLTAEGLVDDVEFVSALAVPEHDSGEPSGHDSQKT